MEKFVLFDGGLGTMLQKNGLCAGEVPEDFCMANPEILKNIHKDYIKSGADIITANTFGSNSLKYEGNLEKAVNFAVKCAKEAANEVNPNVKVALDIGPLGQLLEPVGSVSFEDAYDIFKEVVILGKNAGADLILIETMSDIYEAKCAVLAAKENSELPVFCSMTFDENLRTLTGSDVKTCVAVLEGLRVDAIGLNCGRGPVQSFELAKEYAKYSSTPVLVMPNAGMPKYENGVTSYDIDENEFADEMKKIAELGIKYLGGCCGTTPLHIKKLCEVLSAEKYTPIKKKDFTLISSGSMCLEVTDKPVVIGERINPTGKKKFKEALINGDISYILNEAISQKESGADVLDVNVGIPQIDETLVMKTAVKEIQSVVGLPLQIDSSNAKTVESAMRIYNGKPIINSVNGKKESMDSVFPLVQKYGGAVIGLALDENGIPEKCEDRFKIAEKIVNEAQKYGIEKKDIIIDALVLTASAQQKEVFETIKAVRMIREKLGVKTVLGVSNVSFGLPEREIVNSVFLASALSAGLNFCIINPKSTAIMDTVFAYNVLANNDKSAEKYIERCAMRPKIQAVPAAADAKGAVSFSHGISEDQKKDLIYFIKSGLLKESRRETEKMLNDGMPSMEVIEKYIIPALDDVGACFEKGTMFLPQLIQSAQCAKEAFSEIQSRFSSSGGEKKEKIIIATVKGDVHDIGKNIVKLLLQNYGYDVIDLGKNVDPELIVDTAIKENVRLVGLSALMTTTVVNMEETIKLLKERYPSCLTVVGGAVLTEDYAKSINADFYAKDALKTVEFANRIFGKA